MHKEFREWSVWLLGKRNSISKFYSLIIITMFDYENSPKVRVDLTKILDDKGEQVIDDFGRKMFSWTVIINGAKKELFFGANDKVEKKQFSNGDDYMDAGRIALEGYPEAIVIERSWSKDWKAWTMLTSNIVREDSETKAKVVINKNSWGYMQFSKDPAKRWGFNYSVQFQYDTDRAKTAFVSENSESESVPWENDLPF